MPDAQVRQNAVNKSLKRSRRGTSKATVSSERYSDRTAVTSPHSSTSSVEEETDASRPLDAMPAAADSSRPELSQGVSLDEHISLHDEEPHQQSPSPTEKNSVLYSEATTGHAAASPRDESLVFHGQHVFESIEQQSSQVEQPIQTDRPLPHYAFPSHHPHYPSPYHHGYQPWNGPVGQPFFMQSHLLPHQVNTYSHNVQHQQPVFRHVGIDGMQGALAPQARLLLEPHAPPSPHTIGGAEWPATASASSEDCRQGPEHLPHTFMFEVASAPMQESYSAPSGAVSDAKGPARTKRPSHRPSTAGAPRSNVKRRNTMKGKSEASGQRESMTSRRRVTVSSGTTVAGKTIADDPTASPGPSWSLAPALPSFDVARRASLPDFPRAADILRDIASPAEWLHFDPEHDPSQPSPMMDPADSTLTPLTTYHSGPVSRSSVQSESSTMGDILPDEASDEEEEAEVEEMNEGEENVPESPGGLGGASKKKKKKKRVAVDCPRASAARSRRTITRDVCARMESLLREGTDPSRISRNVLFTRALDRILEQEKRQDELQQDVEALRAQNEAMAHERDECRKLLLANGLAMADL